MDDGREADGTAPQGPSAKGQDRTPAPAAGVLCDVMELAGLPLADSGALWRLAESGRQLDANLVRLPAGRHVHAHVEPELDVLLLVVAGDGVLATPDGAETLAQGKLVWLPKGSSRSITAHGDGLSYLTVHRRRPGMQIRSRPTGDGAPPPTG
ncbi:cupin domain-containing protein [Streptomyces sp. NPDC002491]